jgi:hypothetical protein
VASGVGLSLVVAGLTGGGSYRSEKRATPWVSPWWWLASQVMVVTNLRKEKKNFGELGYIKKFLCWWFPGMFFNIPFFFLFSFLPFFFRKSGVFN